MLIETMKSLKIIPFLFFFYGIFLNGNLVHADTEKPSDYKVFSTKNKNLSISRQIFLNYIFLVVKLCQKQNSSRPLSCCFCSNLVDWIDEEFSFLRQNVKGRNMKGDMTESDFPSWFSEI